MPNYKPMTVRLANAVPTRTWLQLLALQQQLRKSNRQRARVEKKR